MLHLRLVALLALAVVVLGSISTADWTLDAENYAKAFHEGLYLADESPVVCSSCHSFVNMAHLEVELESETETAAGRVDVLFFHSSLLKYVGVASPEGRVFCCTGVNCSYNADMGELMWDKSKHNIAHYIYETTPNSEGQLSLSDAAGEPVTSGRLDARGESGIHYLLFVNCPRPAMVPVRLDGYVIWKNPYGFVPAEQFAWIPFWMAMMIAYLVVAIVWLSLSFWHLNSLLPLQYYVAGIVMVGMMEALTWYAVYQSWNDSNNLNYSGVTIGVLLSAGKWSLSRVLLLAISMGYGIIRSSLGSTTYKIGLAGILYFIFSAALRTSQIGPEMEPEQAPGMLLVLPVAILDTLFYFWIFPSLVTTMNVLATRRQTAKLALFRKLFYVLIASCLSGAVIVVVQLFVFIARTVEELWESLWVWDALFAILYFVILVAVAFLFRPSGTNSHYALLDEAEQGIGMETLGSSGHAVVSTSATASDDNDVALSPLGLLDDEEDRQGKTE